jgi:hypothetical protein
LSWFLPARSVDEHDIRATCLQIRYLIMKELGPNNNLKKDGNYSSMLEINIIKRINKILPATRTLQSLINADRFEC